jgi:hypothetical protein
MTSGFPFPTTYVESSEALPPPTFLTARTVFGGDEEDLARIDRRRRRRPST